MNQASPLVIIFVVTLFSCKQQSPTSSPKLPAPVAQNNDAFKELLNSVAAKADPLVDARQLAVRNWQEIKIPDSTAAACPPFQVKLTVQGARNAVIISVDEISGTLAPELQKLSPEEKALFQHYNTRAAIPLGWASYDYSPQEFPFKPGPIAENFRLAFGLANQARDSSALQESVKVLDGEELVLIAERREKAEVNMDARTFTAGAISGVALLWSYSQKAVICASRFDATNTSAEFKGREAELKRLPETELIANTFIAAAKSLRRV